GGRLMHDDVVLSPSLSFSFSVPTLTVTVSHDSFPTRRSYDLLSNLVTIADLGNVSYQKLELWDSNGTVTGGQFVVNGVAQTGGHERNVARRNAAHTLIYDATSGGTDTLWARLLQDDGTLTAWQ